MARDCGDSGCIWVARHTGMRTNGGCRCLEDGIEEALVEMGVDEAYRISRVLSRELRRDVREAVQLADTTAYLLGFEAGMKK